MVASTSKADDESLVMDIASFEQFAGLLPEPMLLLTDDGTILAGNQAAATLCGQPRELLAGKSLPSLVSQDEQKLRKQLRIWARNRQFLPGVLRWKSSQSGGEPIEIRCDAGVVQPRTETSPAVLLLRCRPKQTSVAAFQSLTQRIDALIHEIGERQRVQSELWAQREWLRVTLSSIGDAVIATDRDGRITLMNPVSEHLTGWTAKEAYGQRLEDVFHIINEYTREPAENPCKKVLRHGAVVGLANHTVLISRDGVEHPIEDSAAPIVDDAGNILGVVLVFHDITEKKLTETAVRNSEQRYRSLVAATASIVWVSDPSGQFVAPQPSWELFTGQTWEQYQGANTFSAVHPEDRTRVEAIWAQSCETGEPLDIRFRLWHAPTSEYRHVHAKAVAVRSGDGLIREWIGTCTDIHQHVLAEAALAESESRFRATFNQTAAGMAQIAPDGRFIQVNQKLCQITGYPRHELLHKTFFDITHPDDMHLDQEYIKQIAAGTRDSYSMEKRYIRKDGSIVWVELSRSVVRDENRQPKYAIAVVHDISGRKQIEEELLEQREWFRTTLASIGDGVIATDEHGHVNFMNPVAEQLTGWTLDAAANKPITHVFNIVNENTRKTVENPVTRVLRDGMIVGLANHTVLRRPAGSEIPIDDSGAPIRGRTGDLLGAVLVFRDITERKQAEKEIRESEQRLRIVADSAPVLLWMSDTQSQCTFFNRGWLEFTGRTIEEELGEGWTDRIHPEDYQQCLDTYRESFEARQPFEIEYRLRRHDGEYRWVLDRGQPRYSADGEFAGFIGSCIDITDRKRDEARLFAEMAFRQAIEESMPSGVAVVDTTGRLTYVNRAFCEMLGWTEEELIGQTPPYVYWPPEHIETIQKELNRLLEGDIPSRGFELCFLKRNGERFEAMVIPSPLYAADGSIHGWLNSVTDITERKRAEKAVRESAGRLRAIVDTAVDAIITIDERGRINSFNKAAERIFGYRAEEIIGHNVSLLMPPPYRDQHDQYLENYRRTGRRKVIGMEREVQGRRKDGSTFPIELAVSETHLGDRRIFTGIVRDITDRKAAEEELKRHREHLEMLVQERTAELEASHQRLRISERMASIGTLAAGIGHDMGNLLLPIRSRIDAMRTEPMSPAMQEHLRAIAQSTNYLQALTNGLRLLALDPDDVDASGSSTDLNKWWPDVESLLRNVLPRGVVLTPQIPGDLPLLRIAPHRLTQAVLNLVNNASDALHERGYGQVIIRAHTAADREHVVLAVIDDGPGMAPDIRHRALEPFFTTKRRGISTGLGLSLVHGIVGSVHGSVHVNSVPGRGGAVILTLPVADEQYAAGEIMSAAVNVSETRTRMFIATMLEVMGITVHNGPPEEFDLAQVWITDVQHCSIERVRRFQTQSANRRIIAFGAPNEQLSSLGVTVLPADTPPSRIREVIRTVVVSQGWKTS